MLNAWTRLHPGRQITVVSTLPDWFIQTRLPQAAYRRASFDTGLVQKDAVLIDIESSLKQALGLLSTWDELVRQERAWLAEQAAELVISDIPALPLEAAAQLGVPAYALGNFSWDWIYSEFARLDTAWNQIVERFRTGYAAGGRLLRYPFSGPMPAFKQTLDIPLVASPGNDIRRRLAAECGADPAKTWLLFCFADLTFTPEGLKNLARYRDYQFFTTGRLNWDCANCFSLDPTGRKFADLVASVDAVVSKPGFGILSDCAANDKPLVYVERENFVEYPVLVEGIDRHLRGLHLPLQKLYNGQMEPALTKLDRLGGPTVKLRVAGAEEVAKLLMGG